jgi:DNA-binding IclR family transcriptional regulator
LEWDPNCLDFHLNERPVRTSSDTQVRKPLYRTSIGRATPYMKHLEELKAAFASGQAAA